MSQRKVFLSFIQKQPDEAIAHFLAKSLAEKNFEVHVVTNELRFGNKNQEKYTSLICGTDVFITLLSERAMVSEMMTVEIQLARQQFDKRKISIVPILINLPDNEIINEVVEQALSGIDLLQWNSQTSNDELLFLLLNRLSGGSKPKTEEQTESNAETKSVRQNTAGIPLPNAPLVPPGGNIAYNSLYYISRSGEDKFVDNILREGALLRIKGPRQFGKTSLLSRTIHFAKQHNHNIVALSFQHFGNDSMNDLDSLLMYLASYTTRKLKLQNRIKDFWEDEFLEGKMKCTAYFEEYILEQIQSPLVLAIDEADRLFGNSILSSDFFGMLRAWHEERNINPIWNKFKLIVSHSTEAYMAISQLNQSPFNIGLERVLNEFSREEVGEFAQRFHVSLSNQDIDELMAWVGGHPYLVHAALYEIASGNYTFKEFIKQAHKDNGPYSDHLRKQLWNLSTMKEYKETMKKVIAGENCSDSLVVHKLRAVGLIKGSFPNLIPGLRIYSEYLKDKL